MGIEPTQSAWEADILPLNYTRLQFRSKKNYTTKTYNSLVVISLFIQIIAWFLRDISPACVLLFVAHCQ